MDQLTAHLDRGWDLVQRGDTVGARASVERALELAPESPEVHNLHGYVCALAGDCDDALEAYQQAVLYDETYVEAMLNAAELLLHPLADSEGAMRMCDQALQITDVPEEMLEAKLIKLEALSSTGDNGAAAKLLSELPAGPYDSPGHNFMAARAHFELGDHERAGPLLEATLNAHPEHPEACYYLGLLFHERGDRRTACAAFLRSRQLDLEMGLPSWAPNAEGFLMFAQNAVKSLPDALQLVAQSAEIYISDMPGTEMIVDGVDPRSMALVDIALLEPPEGEGDDVIEIEALLQPERAIVHIFLYALNTLRVCTGIHDVPRRMAEALEIELRAAWAELADELRNRYAVSLRPVADPDEDDMPPPASS